MQMKNTDDTELIFLLHGAHLNQKVFMWVHYWYKNKQTD